MPHLGYKYTPIDLDKTAIRLLHLYGGQYDSPIYCEIEEVLLGDEGVPYHALSYTWGLNLLQESINVVDPIDGSIKSLPITKSLCSALRHLRDPIQARWLWVDGVCIDQSNPKERAHQVSQMRLVYSAAERVIIWLGDFASDDPDDTTAHDIDVLTRYARRLDKKVVSGLLPPLGQVSYEEQLSREGANSWSVGKMTSAMQTLLHNPWFKRVWIIQEVVSARSAVVVCGDNGYANSIPTRTFVLLPALLSLKPDVQSQSILDVMPTLRGQRTGRWLHGAKLQTLLVKFQHSQCSEQRDFIFALLGMAADGRSITPNYEIREEAVFSNVVAYFLFGNVMKGKDCPLPGEKDVLIKALTDPLGFEYHILMWALTHDHHATAVRILELKEEQSITRRKVDISPVRPPSSATMSSTGSASTSTKPKTLSQRWSSILHLATAQGKVNFVRRLLAQSGISINAKNEKGDSLLSVAALRGDMDMVRLLLARTTGDKIDVNAFNKRGDCALSIIVSRRDRRMARALLARKDIRINIGDTGCDPLASAMAEKDWAMVQLLLEHGANLYPAAATKPTPLMVAVSSDDTTAVRILLRHSPVVDTRNARGENRRAELLAAAIHKGNEEISRLLLAHRDAPEISPDQATELWITANSSGQECIADLLLAHDAPVDVSGYKGSKALMKAVNLHQPTTVDRLVKLGADVNREIQATPPTPLTQAIYSGSIDMVSKLLGYGADVNSTHQAIHQFSPLCYAVKCGSLGIFDLLLQNEHINLGAVFQDTKHTWSTNEVQLTIGDVALQSAVTYGRQAIFQRLWGHETFSVDVNRNYYGPWVPKEPLLGVAAGRGHLSIAKTIVAGAHGKVDLNRTDLAGNLSPLKQAARGGHTMFAEWLLQIGEQEIDMEFGEDVADGTALWCAGEALSHDIAELLLQRGAKTDVECFGYGDDYSPEYRATPLWRAAYKGSVRMVELLLSNGARIDIKGRAKRQSLHNASMSRPHLPLTQAAYGGHADIVRLLIKYGAQPTDVDEIDDAELQAKLKGFVQKAVEDETVLSFHRVLNLQGLMP